MRVTRRKVKREIKKIKKLRRKALELQDRNSSLKARSALRRTS